MKLPICRFDAKTGILCPRCRDRLERGEISELDVSISHDLVEMEESDLPQLKGAEFVRALRADRVTLIFVRSNGVSKTVWSRVAKRLSRRGYGRVRVIEYSSDVRRLAEEMVAPARVLSVSRIWLPDGTSEYCVRIPSREVRRVPLRLEKIEEVMEKLVGSRVRIVPERV
ncbi:MAG: transcription elongation factor [Thermoprotei archaeon]|nr:MAG: transcription elongation factor [Thermoprotei archaeon]